MKVAVRCLKSQMGCRVVALLCGALMSNVGLAAEPQLGDFAAGIELATAPDKPLLELPLPDNVYTTVTHWDLADLRVFNAQGVAVPHAFCPAPATNGKLRTTELPIYTVAAANAPANNDATLTFTTAAGAQLKVTGDNDAQLRSGASYILDARAVDQPLHAVQLDWSLPNGAAETTLRVLASEDLTSWQTLVTAAKLLHAKSSQSANAATPQQLEQQRIALPAAHYQYLRIEPSTADSELIINHANAEYLIPAPPAEPKWFSAGAPRADEDDRSLIYESDHRVPVSYLRVLPSMVNSRMHVTVQSRAQAGAPWQTQWSGEVYSIRVNGEERASAPVKIASTSSPYWRLQFPADSEAPASAPHFDLGYVPLRLRFLAQGAAPYTLAYGSNRAINASAAPCDGLLAGISSPEKREMIGIATPGEMKTLAGSAVLGSSRELPIRKLVLWGLLLAGVAAIVTLAISLLKRNSGREE